MQNICKSYAYEMCWRGVRARVTLQSIVCLHVTIMTHVVASIHPPLRRHELKGWGKKFQFSDRQLQIGAQNFYFAPKFPYIPPQWGTFSPKFCIFRWKFFVKKLFEAKIQVAPCHDATGPLEPIQHVSLVLPSVLFPSGSRFFPIPDLPFPVSFPGHFFKIQLAI